VLCILYVNAVGALLCVAGILIERVLPPSFGRRWLWCILIPTSVVLPGYNRYHYTVTVGEVQHAMQPALGQSLGMHPLSALDPAWWAHIQSYDLTINRLWLGMTALLVLWGAANAWRVYRVTSLARRSRGHGSASTIVDGVPVLVTDLTGPATVGVLRSRVLLPRWVLALPGEQRQYVVRHEEEHRKAHDALLLFVASLPLLLMPWNAAMWWQLRRFCLAVEMDCDNRVVNALGDATAYGELLLRVAEASSRGPRLQPALLGGMGTLERRLTVLLAPTRLRYAQRFLLPAVAFGLLLIVAWMPHPVLGHEAHSNARANSAVQAQTAR
jgi:bla regulator protein blaR1